MTARQATANGHRPEPPHQPDPASRKDQTMQTLPEMTYPPRLPASAAEIPEGQILAHNRVLPAQRQGWRGFRFWYQAPDDRAEPCPCRWAPELGGHYRVRPELVVAPAEGPVMTDGHDHARPDGEPEPEQPEQPEDEPGHARPATGDQLATLAAYRALLTRASYDVQHHSAATGDCPACTAVAAAHFGITLAQQLAGAGFVNGPLIPHLLALIDDTEAELRRSQN